MGNHLSIALVTAALHQLVRVAVEEAVPGVIVRVGPPRAVARGDKEVNLYLYHLTPTARLRDQALPSRSGDGVLFARPQVAVDLHYLIGFAGEDQLAAEVMLAKVLIAFGAMPVLTGEDVEAIVRSGGAFPFLATGGFAAQPERIKLSPEPLSMEETAKLWTAFFQVPHRPSLTYVASPVLLDADSLRGRAEDVRAVDVDVRPG